MTDSNDGRSMPASGDREPLADLVDAVRERRERGSRSRSGDPFDERSFRPVQSSSIWDDATNESGISLDDVVDEGGRTFVVPKREFCERCRHFSEPPAVRCTHPGTEIAEFVDADSVRVHACPVVEARVATRHRPIE